jgi:hypothetical protein
MSLFTSPLQRLALLLGGAVYAFCGALRVTSGDFQGDHNVLDSTAEYLITGALPVALVLTAWAYRRLGERTPRAAATAVGAQLVLAAMCVVSVVNGEDPSFFNAVAPVCLFTWFVSSIVIARGMGRGAVAYALPALVIVTFALSPIGGSIVTGAFWIAMGMQRLSLPRPVALASRG